MKKVIKKSGRSLSHILGCLSGSLSLLAWVKFKDKLDERDSSNIDQTNVKTLFWFESFPSFDVFVVFFVDVLTFFRRFDGSRKAFWVSRTMADEATEEVSLLFRYFQSHQPILVNRP